jgi:hypothetical protein
LAQIEQDLAKFIPELHQYTCAKWLTQDVFVLQDTTLD